MLPDCVSIFPSLVRCHNGSARPFQYLLEKGVFANPALAMRDSGLLHFIDGHHRLAALTDLREKAPNTLFEKSGRQRPASQQTVWIGTHAKSEIPS
jgi:hypothetical protein